MTGRVSIGIPVRNGARYLPEALDSICSQTYANLEIVIGDNASTDDTEAICRSAARADRRITYVRHASDIGAAANHEFVFRATSGRYFAWAAHDDLRLPTAIEACVGALERDPAAVLAFTDTRIVDANGDLVEDYRDDLSCDGNAAHERLASLLLPPLDGSLLHKCFPIYGLARRHALAATGLIRPFRSSDEVLLVELALQGRFARVARRLFLSRQHAGSSLMANPDPRQLARWFGASSKTSYQPYRALVALGQARAIGRVPLSAPERMACAAVFARSLTHERRWRVIGGEVERVAIEAARSMSRPGADNSGRVPGDDRVGRNISGHHRSGADHGALADRHPRQHDDAIAEPDAVPHHDASARREGLGTHRLPGSDSMVVGVEGAARSDVDFFADDDVGDVRGELALGLDVRAGADPNRSPGTGLDAAPVVQIDAIGDLDGTSASVVEHDDPVADEHVLPEGRPGMRHDRRRRNEAAYPDGGEPVTPVVAGRRRRRDPRRNASSARIAGAHRGGPRHPVAQKSGHTAALHGFPHPADHARTVPPGQLVVSVVVPAHNAERTLDRQLSALAAQTFAAPWEVLVVDNASTDRTAKIAERWADILPLRVIPASERLGAAHARNVGTALAMAPLVAYCDADDEVDRYWLEEIVLALASADLVGGSLEHHTVNDRGSLLWRGTDGAAALPMPLGFLPAAISANMGVRRSTWQAIGGWDEAFAHGGDDVDFSWRAQLAGHRLAFAPDAVVRYRHRDTVRGAMRQAGDYARAEVRLYRCFRAVGAPRAPLRAVTRDCAYLVSRLPYLIASRRRRGLWLVVATAAVARVKGSVASRVVSL